MRKLLPQIRYWLKTGRVAAHKIINLHVPELYAIVRGKAGKAVEFGLKWGIARLRGSFLLATLGKDRRELEDSRFAVRAVKDHIAQLGKAPRGYAYDRGRWSRANVAALNELGVKQVGLAPRGRAKWEVAGKVKETLVNERAQVEAGIGTMKCGKYGFNRPAARTAATMGGSGQRAVLGNNLDKLLHGLAAREGAPGAPPGRPRERAERRRRRRHRERDHVGRSWRWPPGITGEALATAEARPWSARTASHTPPARRRRRAGAGPRTRAPGSGCRAGRS